MIERLEQVACRPVSRETFERIQTYVAILREESQRQNLISASTLDNLWERHILDSAQLVQFEPFDGASWVDIGSGAGLPGIVLACLIEGPVTLVEPRRLRADFLHSVVESLDLNATVACARAERIEGRFDVITARAVAPLAKLLEISHHLSTGKSVWALPKGRSGQRELAEASRKWHFDARGQPSCTDRQSTIVVLTGVGANRG
jgi:16S rRNA (guanine527-N7)-methyltransferase